MSGNKSSKPKSHKPKNPSKKVPGYKWKKAKATTNKTEIMSLEKRVTKLQNQIKPATQKFTTYNLGQISLYNNNRPYQQLGIPADQTKFLGSDHGLAMKTLANANEIGYNSYLYYGVTLNYQVTCNDQPAPTVVTIILFNATKLGQQQRTYGTMTSGMDYYIDNTQKVRLNKTFWREYKRDTFELGHFEHLSALPATNSNQAVSKTVHRGSMSHYFKKPKMMKLGTGGTSGTNVWALGGNEIDDEARVQMMVFHNNSHATDDLLLSWTEYCKVLCGS